MSSYVGAVNIVIGATSVPLQKELAKVNALLEGSVYDSNKKLSETYRKMDAINRDMLRGAGRLGKDLTDLGMDGFYKLTVPLGLLTYNAGQSYAEIEKLEKAIESVDGGAALAAVSMREFVELAKMPGLGIQEVNDFYLKMKSVRVESETAFRYIKAFGGEVARGGGGKVEFGRVGRQVAQMLGKQKITQQDLNAITDSAPSFGKVLMDTFGSNTSEALMAKLATDGKTVTDFVNEVVLAMEKLDPVASGFNNALENTSDGWLLFSAELGRAVDVSINATGKLDSLGNMLSGGAIGLKNANLATKQFLTGLGGIVAITPVVLIGLGAISTFLATPFKMGLLTAGSAVRAFQTTLFAGFAPMSSLLAMLGSMAVVTAGVFALVVPLMIHAHERSKEFINVQELQNDIANETTVAYAKQRQKLDELVRVASDQNQLIKVREGALDRIKQLNGDVFKQLTLENIAQETGIKLIRLYNEALEKKTRLQVVSTRLANMETPEELVTKDRGIGDSILDYTDMALNNPGTTINNGLHRFLKGRLITSEMAMGLANQILNDVKKNTQKRKVYTDEIDKLTKELDKMGMLDGSPLGGGTGGAGTGGGAGTKAAERAAEKRVTLHRKMLEDISRLTAENIMDERMRNEELAKLSFLSDVEAKKREYNDAKMPLDEAYFTWLEARAEKSRQEILEAEMKAFQQITLKKMEAIKASDIQSNKDAAVFDIGKAFSSTPSDLPADFLENAIARATEMKSVWETFGEAFGKTNKEMKESLSMLAANTVGNMGVIVGEMMVGTARIQDLGFVILDTLANVLRQLAMVQLATGFAELLTSKGVKGWNKIGAGFALGIGSGIASGAATKQREQARELYNQGRKDRIAPLKVNTKLLGQNLVVSSERTIKNNNNN
jgi:tape measure domain-containing protein